MDLCGMKRTLFISILSFAGLSGFSQDSSNTTDSSFLQNKYLSEITIVGRGSTSDYQQMPEVVGTNIYAGKKSTLIVMNNVQGNVVTNNMRQVLAKVPGIHVWESDPSGIQIGIAARGLSPNRSWEFNTRQNGYDIAADPFGYPEAYYNPQLQAVQRIEVVRGQGSLQYGPQFGGMINYILRNGSEITKKFEFETQQTFGSNNLFNSYNAIGGNTGKLQYYSFFDHRNGDGARDNSKFYTNAGFGTITYKLTDKFSLSAEMMRSHIRSQQAGGLTDAQFENNPEQSFRARNWFDIVWTTPAVTATLTGAGNTRWTTKFFATIGDRNSIGYLPSAGIVAKDSINPAKGRLNDRVLNIDQYRNYAMESRFITDYHFIGIKNTVSGGIRLYTGRTHRQADARDESGRSDYLMTPTTKWGRDVNFDSRNAAAFVENIFRLGKKFIVVPGLRYEWLEGSVSGRDKFNADSTEARFQEVTRARSFILAGVGAEYHVTPTTEFYANYSQAYRPIQFANLQAPPTNFVVDQDMKDAKGFNVDLGYRGNLKSYLKFDISTYYLAYQNRVGNILVKTATPNYTFVTNVGNSTSKGFEGYVEFNAARLAKLNDMDLTIFTSYAYTNSRYDSDHKDSSLRNKKVENAPEHILRGGLTAGYKTLLLTWQFNHVSSVFSDASNTMKPSANGQSGLIPAYSVSDLTLSYKFTDNLNVKAGINNLADAKYFTRRAGGYPGPGVLPADGRTWFVSLGAKF
jgi:Fe(3+) dicitrate transport protein